MNLKSKRTKSRFSTLDSWFYRMGRNESSRFSSTLHYLYWWHVTESIIVLLKMYEEECPACGHTLAKVERNLSPETFIGHEASSTIRSFIKAGIDPTDSPEYKYLNEVLLEAGLVGHDIRPATFKAFVKLWQKTDFWLGEHDTLLSFNEVVSKTKVRPSIIKAMLSNKDVMDRICYLPGEKAGFDDMLIDFKELLRIWNIYYRARKYKRELTEVDEVLCYRDMTFCQFWTKCVQGKDCFRALTRRVRRGAEKTGLAVSSFLEPPKHCFILKDGAVYDEKDHIENRTEEEDKENNDE